MIQSRLNLFIAAISCFAVLSFSFFVVGCGDEGNDDDDDVIAPDVTNGNPPPPDDTNPPDPPEDIPDPPVEEPGVSFQNDVLPVLQANCALPACHGGNPPTGGLRLTDYDGLNQGGRSGRAFEPGNSDGSPIVKRITGAIQPQMPLGGAPLKDDQIQLIADWIDEGGENN